MNEWHHHRGWRWKLVEDLMYNRCDLLAVRYDGFGMIAYNVGLMGEDECMRDFLVELLEGYYRAYLDHNNWGYTEWVEAA